MNRVLSYEMGSRIEGHCGDACLLNHEDSNPDEGV